MKEALLRPLPILALILAGGLFILKLTVYAAIAAVAWLFLVGLETMRTSDSSDSSGGDRGGTL